MLIVEQNCRPFIISDFGTLTWACHPTYLLHTSEPSSRIHISLIFQVPVFWKTWKGWKLFRKGRNVRKKLRKSLGKV